MRKKKSDLSKIIIKDYPCGSGKTTSMISSFDPKEKYLVIVPYLSEVERIISESKVVKFCQPIAEFNDSHNTKYDSLELLLAFGNNIVTTHKLYNEISILAEQGLLNDYHIIIDEVPEVCSLVTHKTSYSIKEFYVDKGFIEVNEDGLVSATDKWDLHKNNVSDTLDGRIYNYAKSGSLYLLDDQLFIWAMPKCLLSSGLSLTILTYKAEGSILLSYLKKLGFEPIIKRNISSEHKFRENAAKLITVKSIPSIEKLNFSFSGQISGRTKCPYYTKVSTALKNLRSRELKGIPLKNILITCSKNLWFKNGKNKTDGTSKTAGFSKNSKMFNVNWIPNTTRGTNDYAHCSVLIYLHDQYLNPLIARWLNVSSQKMNDSYALTELIQWIWRSQVRNGKPITVYIPSPRMRRIFLNWLHGGIDSAVYEETHCVV